MNPEPRISADEKLMVCFVGSAEPNYGRMLWQVDITFNGGNVNSKLFRDNWRYINFDIEYWELNNEKSSFYYIPVEGISKLISSKSFQIIDLPYQEVSTIRFFGNKFVNNNLIEIFTDQIVITNLGNFNSRIEKMEDKGQINGVRVFDKEIEISKFLRVDRIKKTTTYIFDIEV